MRRTAPGGAGPSDEHSHAGSGDMPAGEFREHAHDVVDWIAAFLDEVGDYPVLSRARPGELRGALPDDPPEEGEPMARILSDFREIVLPGVTHWNHPSFHGYFAVTGSGPGILGEMLAAALNVNAMVWRSSPAATELEEHVVDWCRRLLGLPEGFGGTIQDTASTSSLVALGAARLRAYPKVGEEGLFAAPRGRVYTSEQAHSSIEKAVVALGLGRSGLRKIAADERFRMRPDALRAAMDEDRAAGILPVAVVATIGTTSSASADPMGPIADLAQEAGAWLHVDAAYAGAAASVPELRPAVHGWERADSIVFNPHKWLFTPVDCSVLLTRRRAEVRGAFSLVPEYLRTAEGEGVTNLMDYGIALGRRFRALKLWFVLRYFGAEGIRSRIREHVVLARRLGERIEAEPDWELVAPVGFSTAVFRWAPAGLGVEAQDELNMALMEEVNAGGEAFLSHTRLAGRIALRLSIGNLRTRAEHVDRAWELLREAARTRAAGLSPPAPSPPAPAPSSLRARRGRA